MTVKLVRAYEGYPAGATYDGSADEEVDLVAKGNAVWDIRGAIPGGGPGDVRRDWVVRADERRFGGTFTGGSSDVQAITSAALEAAQFEPRKNLILPPLVGLGGADSSIYIPARVLILCCDYTPGDVNTRLIPLAGMTLSTGFVFNMNTTDGTTVAESPTWDARGFWCGIFGVEFDNSVANVAGARLCAFAYRLKAQDLKQRRATQLIKRVPASYADGVHISDVTLHPSHDNSEYQIELGQSGNGGGDNYVIDRVITSTTDSGDGLPNKAIYVYTGNSGQIRNCINGEIYVKQNAGVSITQLHQEFGSVILENTSGTVAGFTSQLHDTDTYYPIDLQASGDTVARYHVTLADSIFKGGQAGFDGHPPAEVRLTGQHTLVSVNSRRLLQAAGEKTSTGFRINNASDVAVDSWNDHAAALSLRGSISGYVASGTYDVWASANDFLGVYNAITKVTGASGSSGFPANTTFYYKAQLLLDKSKMIGRNQTGAELSVTTNAVLATAQTQRHYMPLGFGTSSKVGGIVRVYRGTTSNSYDNYVDVPLIGTGAFSDDFNYGLGLPWQSRGAGPVDTIYSVLGDFTVTPHDGAVGRYNGENANVGDADDTAIGIPGYAECTVVLATALTASRTYTINSAITTLGAKVKFVRNNAASGAFNAVVKDPGGTTLRTLASNNTWVIAELCSGSVWRAVAYGTL